MRKHACFLIVLLMVASIHLAYAKNHPYGAIILLDEVRDTFDAQGHETWYEHERIEVLNTKGIQEFGEIVIPFSTQFQRLKLIKAVTILPNGKRLKPAKNAYNIVSPPFVMEAPIYSDIKYQTISMPGLCPGSVIDYAYELKTIKPYMPGQFWAKNLFQQEYPVKKAIYQLTVPKNKMPKILLKHIKIKPQKKVTDKTITFTFKVHNLPAIDLEPHSPPLGELAASIAISSVPSWQKVARWYYQLAKKALIPDTAIKNQVKVLTQGCSSKWEKIRAIYNYVAQNIRYVGVEFGINGYKPHPASQIFKLRYGDCKDHSTLLIAMLKAAGIKAYPVLIPTSEIPNLDVRLPMPGAFDHEITAVKLNGRYVFLDSTAESASCGDLPPSDQGRRVLIVGNQGQAILTQTPVFPPQHNQEVYKACFSLDADGRLRGNGALIYQGVYAMFRREQFIHMTPEERKRELEKTINNISPGAKLLKMNISDYLNLNQSQITINFDFKDDFYATKTAHLLLFHPPLLPLSHLASFVAMAHRHYPYELGYCFLKRMQITIHLPLGYRLQFIPENYVFKNQAGSLILKWHHAQDTITAEEVLMVTKSQFSPSEYPALRQLFTRALKLNRNQLVILRHTAFAAKVKAGPHISLKWPPASLQRQVRVLKAAAAIP